MLEALQQSPEPLPGGLSLQQQNLRPLQHRGLKEAALLVVHPEQGCKIRQLLRLGLAVFFQNHRLIAVGQQPDFGGGLGRQRPGAQKQLLDNGASGLLPVVLRGIPGGALPVEGGFEIPEHLLQFLFVDGLGDVVLYPLADGLLGIFEVGIAADNNDLAPVPLGPGLPDNLQPGKPRHPDIHQHHIRLQGLNLGQSLVPIRRLTANGKPQGRIVKQNLNPLPNDGLIIRNQNGVHTASLPVKL